MHRVVCKHAVAAVSRWPILAQTPRLYYSSSLHTAPSSTRSTPPLTPATAATSVPTLTAEQPARAGPIPPAPTPEKRKPRIMARKAAISLVRPYSHQTFTLPKLTSLLDLIDTNCSATPSEPVEQPYATADSNRSEDKGVCRNGVPSGIC